MQPSADGPFEHELTQLLRRMSQGDTTAAARVWESLYPDLLRRARRMMQRQPTDHSLDATALIGLAYERIRRLDDKVWADRNHFLATAALSMHSALVDHARRRKTRAAVAPSPLDEAIVSVEERVGNLTQFEDAVARFDDLDPQTGKALRLMSLGYGVSDVADMLAVPRRTLKRNLTRARSLVHRLMS